MKYTRGPWTVTEQKTFEGKDQLAIYGHIDRRIQRVANTWIQGNANLIVSAVNACMKVNPENPMAVAESIGAMREALEFTLDLLTNLTTEEFRTGGDKPARDKIEAAYFVAIFPPMCLMNLSNTGTTLSKAKEERTDD